MSKNKFFSQTIISWYHQNKRDLPWRDTQNPYKIWLSEIILQQTRVVQGMPYYEKFIKHFPTVGELAAADEQTVLRLWQGLGYYSRARNLHAAAKYIVEELNGIFPKTYSEIKKLKGVGDYTAAAIASFAFDEVEAVVDGNVYRVLSRFFGVEKDITETKSQKYFRKLAQNLITTTQPAIYNQAIMEFGALQCVPKNPKCSVCPLQKKCMAFEKSLVEKLPIKSKKTKVKERFVYYYVFKKIQTHKQKVLVRKREAGDIWQGLYDFFSVEFGNQKAKKFDAMEELKIILKSKVFDFPLQTHESIIFKHQLSHRTLYAKFYTFEFDENSKEHEVLWSELKNQYQLEEIKWQELDSIPKPVLISNYLNHLENHLF